MTRIKTLIVDDEPLARDGLREHLRPFPDIEVVGEAVDGPSAVDAIRTLQPDLVLLDVQMPGMSGFEVLRALSPETRPSVVFVTAFDRYALDAFEVHALDYLLKPVTPARLHAAVARAREQLQKAGAWQGRERLAELLESLPAPGSRAVRRLTIKDGNHFRLVETCEVEWLESAGNYVKVHRQGNEYLLRSPLGDLEGRLDAEEFVRIHRSAIVNLAHVEKVRPDANGDYDVILKNGTQLRLSRTYRNRLLPRT